jgi:hypothetical protein
MGSTPILSLDNFDFEDDNNEGAQAKIFQEPMDIDFDEIFQDLIERGY